MQKRSIFSNNTFLQSKFSAGALQYVIFITVVISLLLCGFVLLNQLQQELRIRTNITSKLAHFTDESINYALHNNLREDGELELSFSEIENYKTKIISKRWGLYDLVTVCNSFKNDTIKKSMLLGGRHDSKPALYLKDNNKPLVLVGNAKLMGSVYLPKRGVRTGYIAGESYYNSKLVYGSSFESTNRLPDFQNKKKLMSFATESKGRYYTTFSLDFGMKKSNSFMRPTQVYKSNGVVTLSNIELIGNCYVISDTLIKVTNTAILKNTILIAPRVIVSDNVHSSFQVFATESIEVGEYCKLSYPSVLFVYEEKEHFEKKGKSAKKINIGENSKIQGTIAYVTNSEKSNYYAHVKLSNNAVVDGEVYCDKNIELIGTVNGAVYCSGFVANRSGSSYQNHIYGGTINGNVLPFEYGGLQFQHDEKNIVEWLY